MKKAITICIVVIILIVILNIITENHTNAVMDEIVEDLDIIREKLIMKNSEDLNENIEEIVDKWKERSKSLAYYIEHDEIEKVELYLLETKSNIEVEEYNIAVTSLDSCKFIIEHIKDKYTFKLVNIF